MFFQRKFIIHRLLGLSYLLQFTYACILWATSADFYGSWVSLTLPASGVVQTVTAMYYFRFLPKKQVSAPNRPGYFFCVLMWGCAAGRSRLLQ